jgi:cell division protein FtsB
MSLFYNPNIEGTSGKMTPAKQMEKISNEQEKQQKMMNAQRQEILIIRWIMVAVIIVLLVAFIGALLTVYGIIQDYLGLKTASTQELVNKINNQGAKIDLLEQGYVNAGIDLVKLKTYFGIK